MKLSAPIPGPITPDPLPPEPFNPPRMAPVPMAVKASVWRVREADLDEIGPWLIGRMKEKWPRLSDQGFIYWLKTAMNDKNTLLCRSERVVALAYAETSVLEPFNPIVTERWLRWKEKADEESVLVVRYERDWAKAIKARWFRMNDDSDVGMNNVIVPGITDMKAGFLAPKRLDPWVMKLID